nr:MAG TPA: hypothetical protein [Caudoviricetes sp.]
MFPQKSRDILNFFKLFLGKRKSLENSRLSLFFTY